MSESGRSCPSCNALVPGTAITCPSCGALSLPPAPALADSIAARLGHQLGGRYRIERELGQGGMAIVYLAHDFKLDREVALKVMRPDLTFLPTAAPRFLREIGIAAKLHHPGILTLYDSGEADGLLYYVMPYEEGETLRTRLASGSLPVAEALRIGQELADALAYAHERGILHRDIKPENVLLLAHGHVALADFGIARALAADDANITTTGVRVGSPLYMSPEQFVRNATDLGPASDVYALGCVVFEMLTGSPPYPGHDFETLMRMHCADPVPSLRSARPEIPLAVEAVVRRALAKDPAARFAGAAEFAAALGSGAGTPRISLRTMAAAWRVHARVVLLAGGLVIAALAAVLGMRHPAGPPPATPAALRLAIPSFVAVSGQVATQARGLAEALGSELARVPRIAILPGRDHATHVVQGTVLGARPLRVTLRIVDATSGRPIGDTTEGDADDAVLVGRLAAFVRRRLGASEDSVLWRRSFRSDSAWQLSQLSRARMNTVIAAFLAGTYRKGAEAMASADSLMRAAAQLEPGSSGHIALASSRTTQAFFIEFLRQARLDSAASLPDPHGIRLTALPMLDSVVARDPGNTTALRLRGWVKYELLRVGGADSLLAGAIRDLEQATRQRETDPLAWVQLADAYNDSGLFAEQAFAYTKARDADVFLQYGDVILRGTFDAALRTGQPRDADEACRTAQRDYPDDERFVDCELKLLAYTATTSAQASRALTLADSMASPRNATNAAMWRTYAAEALARSGRSGDAARQLQLVERSLPPGAAPSFVLTEMAQVKLLLNDRAAAAALVRRAVLVEPRLRRSLLRDPRFRVLRAALG